MLSNAPLSHVACVDDDDDILHIASLALVEIGQLRATTFHGARSALDGGLSEARPDLLLMDVMMPEMDGPTCLRTLRARGDLKDLPVVFMTARVQPSEVRHYLALGVIGVVGKPFDPMTLADDVRRIWEDWRDVVRSNSDSQSRTSQ